MMDIKKTDIFRGIGVFFNTNSSEYYLLCIAKE